MYTITKSKEEISVIREVDVAIIGGGPSGVIAAVAAARNKAKTLLIERYGFLGGNAAMGLPILGFFNDREGKQVIKGIPEEMVNRMRNMGGATENTPCPHHSSYVMIDPEILKCTAQQLVIESGADLLFHCLGVDIMKDRNGLWGLIIQSKSGRQAILAKVVIDATGDGDIAVAAGASYEKGRPGDGLMQPPTFLFTLGNVNIDGFMEDVRENPRKYESYMPIEYYKERARFIYIGLDGLIKEARKKGEFPNYRKRMIFVTMPRRNEVLVNVLHIPYTDGTDVFDLTRAEIRGREQLLRMRDFFKKYVPGFESCYIITTTHQIAIRETRRIMGEYLLTGEDILQCKKFSDVITKNGYYMDVHSPDPLGKSPNPPPSSGSSRFRSSYDIPYRCLLPKGIQNFLITGRCISVTWEALGSTRVMAPCMALGQAAGTAAALAVRDGVTVRELDAKTLQEQLTEDDANLK
jgi:hypothetical protein